MTLIPTPRQIDKHEVVSILRHLKTLETARDYFITTPPPKNYAQILDRRKAWAERVLAFIIGGLGSIVIGIGIWFALNP
jgi:hypothetical protein